MSNVKITALPSSAGANFTDLYEKVNDPTGTPTSQSQSLQQTYDLFAYPALATLSPTSGTSYTVDMKVAYSAITTNSQIDFTATSNRAAVRSATILINSSVGSRNFTFNASWIFLGAAAPVSIAANKVGVLSLTAFGAGEANIVAVYSVQP